MPEATGFTRPAAMVEAKKMIEENQESMDHEGLTFLEFEHAFARSKLGHDDHVIHAVFKAIDTDHNGYITIEELRSVFKGSEQMVNFLENELDEDHDGKITMKEFEHALK